MFFIMPRRIESSDIPSGLWPLNCFFAVDLGIARVSAFAIATPSHELLTALASLLLGKFLDSFPSSFVFFASCVS